MDKASDFESEDCGFDPHHGQVFLCADGVLYQYLSDLIFYETVAMQNFLDTMLAVSIFTSVS